MLEKSYNAHICHDIALFFLGDDLGYYDFYANVNNVSFFEKKINEFFNKNIKFPRIQTGGNDYNINLNSFQKNKIGEIYKTDFDFIS